jgi:hypothetical protein
MIYSGLTVNEYRKLHIERQQLFRIIEKNNSCDKTSDIIPLNHLLSVTDKNTDILIYE